MDGPRRCEPPARKLTQAGASTEKTQLGGKLADNELTTKVPREVPSRKQAVPDGQVQARQRRRHLCDRTPPMLPAEFERSPQGGEGGLRHNDIECLAQARFDVPGGGWVSLYPAPPSKKTKKQTKQKHTTGEPLL